MSARLQEALKKRKRGKRLTGCDDRVGLAQRRLQAHNHRLLAVVPAGAEQGGAAPAVRGRQGAQGGHGGGS